MGQLAQFLDNPGHVHWEAAKRVVRYLKGTMELKLTYGGGKQRGIEAYVDADGVTLDHRRAISGFVVLVDRGAVSWSSKKQELVTLSTMEAEYVGATHATKELVRFRHLIKEIRPLIFPTILRLDNQSTIILVNSESQFHAHTKHICYDFTKLNCLEQSMSKVYLQTEHYKLFRLKCLRVSLK